LNFSRPGAQVIGQYYNFIRLGREGYREVQQSCRDTAMYVSAQVAKVGPYELLSDGSELPVLFFRLKPEVTNYTVYDVSAKLRERGWQVPAYSLPANLTDLSGLRVVVRNGFGATWPTSSSTTFGVRPASRVAPREAPRTPATRSRSALSTNVRSGFHRGA
jgi:glutamate decarboxylase